MEKWKPIEGFEDFYLISNKGRVKSLARKVWRSNRRGCPPIEHYQAERVLKPRICKGYMRVALSSDKIESKEFRIHYLVAMHFLKENYF